MKARDSLATISKPVPVRRARVRWVILAVGRRIKALHLSQTQWRHLTTFSDFPSAQVFADALTADGIGVRVISEAPFLGQAAPARIFIPSEQFHRGQRFMSASLNDEELTRLSLEPQAEEEPQR